MEGLTCKVDEGARTLPVLPASDADAPKPDFSVANTAVN